MPLSVRSMILSLAFLADSSAAGDVFVAGRDLAPGPDGLAIVRGIDVPRPPPSARQLPLDIAEPAYGALRAGLRKGTSVGFGAFLYDNRDRGHSSVPASRLPALQRVRYRIGILASRLDRGIAHQMLFPVPTLGNASLAQTGAPQARSLPRIAMMDRALAARMARLYRSNHLYVFPEHRDHDAVDRFPANWPYTVVSQGSSGSDLPFVEALAMTLAAVPRDTFAAIEDTGLVAPVLQMILRRNMRGIGSDAAYLTGRAHPPVFDANDLDVAAMVRHAASLRPEDIVAPPELRVDAESFGDAEGLAGLSERLFDTPHAIGRVWRGFAARQTLSVSVAGAGTEGVTYHWRLLRGDPDRASIRPVDGIGASAEIAVDWHGAFADTTSAADEPVRTTSRVDIAVFADNRHSLSAPSMISIFFPAHQERDYADGTGLVSIDYGVEDEDRELFDPFLFWQAPWTDTAIRDANGIAAWERSYHDGTLDVVPLEGVAYTRSGPAGSLLGADGP